MVVDLKNRIQLFLKEMESGGIAAYAPENVITNISKEDENEYNVNASVRSDIS